MESNENFLQNCMVWLTDISLVRARVINIRKRLLEARLTLDSGNGNEQFITIIQGIHTILNRLENTEVTILFYLKESTKIPALHPFLKKASGEWSENELFAKMKDNYTRFVDLQQLLHVYLNGANQGTSSSIRHREFKEEAITFPSSVGKV